MDVTTLRTGILAVRYAARRVLTECDRLEDALDEQADPSALHRRLRTAAEWASDASGSIEILWRTAENQGHIAPRTPPGWWQRVRAAVTRWTG